MKFFFIPLLLMNIATQAQVAFDALKISTTFPRASQNISFNFNQNMSPLKSKKNIEVSVYEFTTKGMIVKEPLLKKTGSTYSGTVMIDSNANVIAFAVNSGDAKDNNSGQGYIVPVYHRNNEPVKGYYASAGELYAGYGSYLFGMAIELEKCIDLLELGMKKYPDLASEVNFYKFYFGAILEAKKPGAQSITLEKLKEIESKPQLNETEYNTMARWYGRYKMKVKADSLTAVKKEKFPNGNWVNEELTDKFNKEKDAQKKAVIYESYIANSTKEKIDESNVNYMKSQVAYAYYKEKNNTLFAKWISELPMAQKASLYNDISWNMVEKGENLPMVKKMSEEAVLWAKQQINKPTDTKPASITVKQWEEQRKEVYSMYSDTYALILYKMGEYKKGLPYAREAATIRKLKDPGRNERYALLLEKTAPASEAKKIIEDMVKLGNASSKTKEILKSLYVKELKSENGFDKYLSVLESDAKLNMIKELAKIMTNTASPKFSLKDWDGKEVSLGSLKGKILVIDFWATWCGPCIASMPGLKKAQEKLAGRDDVQFLFVNTLERADNKLENSKDFMKEKNYAFYVLMDDENKMAAAFGVTGIPQKFIIDKNGNIRFKTLGFEGNVEELANEVVIMVEMAGK
ncbi:MAG: TlpA disulfide reductase family protein [Ferruginibacter sp.]